MSEKVTVWVPSPLSLYVRGTVAKKDWLDTTLKTLLVTTASQSAVLTVDRTALIRCNEDASQPDDLTSLVHLDEANLLSALSQRYTKGTIYTFMANILIAVNPYRDMAGMYDVAKYKQSTLQQKDPHVFAVAQRALEQMQCIDPRTLGYQPQSIICCGESGSGKTVSTRQIMRYLCGEQSVSVQRILDSNPVLEAFGNAQTLRNHNSSRFAKFIKIYFEQSRVVHAHTETYLLERSRLVAPPEGERNFHVLYYLAAARHAKATFKYLGASKYAAADPVREFEALEQCLRNFALANDTIEHVWNVCSGILHLGNIAGATEVGTDDYKIHKGSADVLAQVAKLWQISGDALRKYLETRNLYVSREVVNTPFSVHEARVNRDALAKYLYDSLFQWIVRTLNQSFASGVSKAESQWIGILDVFGFESFDTNSFEQLCINLANEKLQHFFNQYVLQSEQAEYIKESILWHPVRVDDNGDTLQLLEGRPSGILSLLDSICVMPKGTPRNLVENIFALHRQHPRLKLPPPKVGDAGMMFTVAHYAAPVIYNASHFLSKNNDSQNSDLLKLFDTSQNALIRQFGTANSANVKSARFSSVSRLFQQQLQALLDTLNKTTPFFVRCINPNPKQQPVNFDWKYVQPQVKLGGLLQAVEMLKYGYPFRLSYDKLAGPLVSQLTPQYVPYPLTRPVFLRNICEAILQYLYRNETPQYQLGLTKILFKSGQQRIVDDILDLGKTMPPALAQHIVAWIRKRRWHRMRAAVNAFTHMQRRVAGIRQRYRFRRTVRVVVIIRKTMFRMLRAVRKGYRKWSGRSLRRTSLSIAPTMVPPDMPLDNECEQNVEKLQITSSLETLQRDMEELIQQREELLAQQLKIRQDSQRAAEDLERGFREREASLQTLLKQTESDWQTEYRLACEEHERKLAALAEHETALAQSLRSKSEEVEHKSRQLDDVMHKQQTLEQLLADREQRVKEKEQELSELQRQQEKLQSDLRNVMTNSTRALEEQKKELLQSYRRESMETKSFFESNIGTAQQTISQYEQVLTQKNKVIERLHKQIEQLEAMLTQRVADYQTSVQRTFERRIRQLEKTIHIQRTEIIRLTSASG